MIEVIFKIFLTDYIDFQGFITKRIQKPLLIEYNSRLIVRRDKSYFIYLIERIEANLDVASLFTTSIACTLSALIKIISVKFHAAFSNFYGICFAEQLPDLHLC